MFLQCFLRCARLSGLCKLPRQQVNTWCLAFCFPSCSAAYFCQAETYLLSQGSVITSGDHVLLYCVCRSQQRFHQEPSVTVRLWTWSLLHLRSLLSTLLQLLSHLAQSSVIRLDMDSRSQSLGLIPVIFDRFKTFWIRTHSPYYWGTPVFVFCFIEASRASAKNLT